MDLNLSEPNHFSAAEKIKKIIRLHTTLFRDIEESALKKISARLLLLVIPTGIDIIRQGDLREKLFIVVSGALDVFVKTNNGETKKVGKILPVDCVGERTLITQEPRNVLYVQKVNAGYCLYLMHIFKKYQMNFQRRCLYLSVLLQREVNCLIHHLFVLHQRS